MLFMLWRVNFTVVSQLLDYAKAIKEIYGRNKENLWQAVAHVNILTDLDSDDEKLPGNLQKRFEFMRHKLRDHKPEFEK